MPVFDCFIFARELDVLEIRLATLEDVVDVHVIAEAPVDHAGRPKPLHLRENWERFRRWHSKIRYVVVDDMPEGKENGVPRCDFAECESDRWRRENHQRAALIRGCDGLRDDDLVHLSDADEIPALSSFGIPIAGGEIVRPALPMHIGYLNWRWRDPVIVISRFMRGETLLRLGPQGARLADAYAQWSTGGWHLAYMGGPTAVADKIRAAAHAELDRPEFTDEKAIAERLARGRDIFGRADRRSTWVGLDQLPPPVQRDPARYRHLMVDRPCP